MIDPTMAKVYARAECRKKGMDPDEMKEKEVHPAVIEKNKQILKKKKRVLNIVMGAGVLIFLTIFILLTVADLLTDGLLAVVIVAFIVLELSFSLELSALKQKKNICPYCYAYKSWSKIRQTQIGQQQTSVEKQVVTKHYAPDPRHKGKLGSEFNVQYYQGKSVTTAQVPATRYLYREAYQCSCCKNVKYTNSSRVV